MNSIFMLYRAYIRKNKKDFFRYLSCICLCFFCIHFALLCQSSSYKDVVTYNSFYSGDYHLFLDATSTLKPYISEKEYDQVGYGYLDSITDKMNLTIDLYAITQKCLYKPLAELNGRMPNQDNEICIYKQYADDYGIKINDVIKLKRLNHHPKEYIVSGIYNKEASPYLNLNQNEVFITFDEEVQPQKNFIWISEINDTTAAQIIQDYNIQSNTMLLSSIQILSDSIMLKLIQTGIVISMLLVCGFLILFIVMDIEKKQTHIQQLKQLGASKHFVFIYTMLYSLFITSFSFVTSFFIAYLCISLRFKEVVISSSTHFNVFVFHIILVCLIHVMMMKQNKQKTTVALKKTKHHNSFIRLIVQRLHQKSRMTHVCSLLLTSVCILFFIINTSIMFPFMNQVSSQEQYVLVRLNYQDNKTYVSKTFQFIEELLDIPNVNHYDANVHFSLSNGTITAPRCDEKEGNFLSLNVVFNDEYQLDDQVAYFQNYYDVCGGEEVIESYQIFELEDVLTFQTSQYEELEDEIQLHTKNFSIPIAPQKISDLYFPRVKIDVEQVSLEENVQMADCGKLYMTPTFFIKNIYAEMFDGTMFEGYIYLYGNETQILSKCNEIRRNYPGFVRECSTQDDVLMHENLIYQNEKAYFQTYFLVSMIIIVTLFVLFIQMASLNFYRNKNLYRQLNQMGWTNTHIIRYCIYDIMFSQFMVLFIVALLLFMIHSLILQPMNNQIRLEMVIFILILYLLYMVFTIVKQYNELKKE